MVELGGIEPSAGISVRRNRHAAVSPIGTKKANVLLGRSGCWPFSCINIRVSSGFPDAMSREFCYHSSGFPDSMNPWTFYDFLDSRGVNLIRAWLDSLPAKA